MRKETVFTDEKAIKEVATSAMKVRRLKIIARSCFGAFLILQAIILFLSITNIIESVTLHIILAVTVAGIYISIMTYVRKGLQFQLLHLKNFATEYEIIHKQGEKTH